MKEDDSGEVEAVCGFCAYGFKKRFESMEELQRYMAEWEGHLLMEHCSDLVEFMVGKTGICHDREYTKRRITKSWAVDLVSGHPDDVECPFCDYVPPEKYESSGEGPFEPPIPSPWEDTKMHIADEHWEEFLQWIDSEFLSIHEIAMEKLEQQYCEIEWDSTE